MTGKSNLDHAALDEIIRSRRTIKPPMMSPEPVREEDLRAVLENANWAPTHGLTEPWRFKIYRGEARAKLADALGTLYETALAPEDQKEGKADKLRKMPRLAPTVILVCMERQKIEKIRELEEIEAVACAVQNMHLTAASRGLGAFWSTPPFIYKPEMNAWLGLGEKDRCLGIFYLGYPAESEKWPKSRRRSIEDKIEFIDA
jgi:nitroreductase